MKNLGIWMDSDHSRLVFLEVSPSEITDAEHITVQNHHHNPHDKTHHEFHEYFEAVLNHVPHDVHAFFVFGPSETKTHFEHYLHDKHAHFGPKLLAVESSEHMTEHQIESHVKHFFEVEAKKI